MENSQDFAEKKKLPRFTTKQAQAINDTMLDSTAWLTPDEAENINRKLDRDYIPVIMVNGPTVRSEFWEIIDEYIKYVTKSAGVKIEKKVNLYKEKNEGHTFIFITKSAAEEFFCFLTSDVLGELDRSLTTPAATPSGFTSRDLYIIRPDNSLVLAGNFDEKEYRTFKYMARQRAPEFESVEEMKARMTSETEQTEKAARTKAAENAESADDIDASVADGSNADKIMSRYRPQKANINWYKSTPRKKIERGTNPRPRVAPRYVRYFTALMEHFGQDFATPLLPIHTELKENCDEKVMTVEKQKSAAENQGNFKSKSACRGEANSTCSQQRREECRPVQTEEERKQAHNNRVKDYQKRKKAEYQEYLNSLSPAEAAAVEAERLRVQREAQKAKRARAEARRQAALDAMTPEEQAEFFVQEAEQREIQKEKHREASRKAYYKNLAKTTTEKKSGKPADQAKAEKNAKSREAYRKKMDAMTPEEQKAYHKKRKEAKEASRERKLAAMTPEEREAALEAEKQKNLEKYEQQKQREANILAQLTPAEQEEYFKEKRRHNAEIKRRHREKKAAEAAAEQAAQTKQDKSVTEKQTSQAESEKSAQAENEKGAQAAEVSKNDKQTTQQDYEQCR